MGQLNYPKKANGKLRICLDPKDLNKVIIHENHMMNHDDVFIYSKNDRS